MRYRAIRLVAANLFNTSTIRLIASFSLMGTVFAGVAFGMTEYGDTARLIGAAIAACRAFVRTRQTASGQKLPLLLLRFPLPIAHQRAHGDQPDYREGYA